MLTVVQGEEERGVNATSEPIETIAELTKHASKSGVTRIRLVSQPKPSCKLTAATAVFSRAVQVGALALKKPQSEHSGVMGSVLFAYLSWMAMTFLAPWKAVQDRADHVIYLQGFVLFINVIIWRICAAGKKVEPSLDALKKFFPTLQS